MEKSQAKFKETQAGTIPKDWRCQPLGKHCTVFIPMRNKPKIFRGDIPWLRIEDLDTKYVSDTKSNQYVNDETVKRMNLRVYPAGTVLCSCTATIGVCAITKRPLTTNQQILGIYPNSEITNEFLYYHLLTRTKDLTTIGAGTITLYISRERIEAFPIVLPSHNEQQSIVKILSDLDYKIQLIRDMNRVLEEIGNSIFKHWFVRFEFPNEEGKPYKSSGGDMVYNEQLEKEIPRGWEVSDIGTEFNLVMGQSPPGNSYNENGDGSIFFQGRADFGSRFPSIRMFCTEPRRFARKGDTLVSVRAPVGDINLTLQDCSIGRGLAAIRHKSNYSSYTYYYMTALKTEFDRFEGEGTVFGSISKVDFEKIKIVAPPINIMESFENTIAPLDKKVEDNVLQELTLSRIRNSLLPHLLSGKIRVLMKAA